MNKIISLGKVDYLNIGKKSCEVTIEIELREKEKGQEVLSISGNIWNNIKTDIYSGGQNLETIKAFRGQLDRDKLFDKIYRLWKLYHLNDMHTGTKKQEQALAKAKLNNWANNYDKCCNYLESIGLLVDNGYKFGTSWLYEAIPEQDLKEIRNIINEKDPFEVNL